MGFTTSFFLFVFFPLSLGIWTACRLLERCSLWRRLRAGDWALLALSLGFYGWALFDGVFWLCGYVLAVWAAGRLILWGRGWRLALPLLREGGGLCSVSVPALTLGLGTAALLAALFRCKYWAFAGGLFPELFGGESPLAPLGISFLTFSAVSYLADVYRGSAPAGSLLDCGLYLTFFPKVISGPIVLWKEFQPQLHGRRTGLEDLRDGVERFILGFAKKLILADMFGACVAEIDAAAVRFGVDAPTAWLAVLLYMLQIYYDFAGYSDIALGLGRMFGFRFKENFHFPYRSRSITEFWRRWHISLGTWFREYVYFPLGGSRGGLRRTLWNLAAVFALTGLWHGAGWNYILWGGINGACVLLERVWRDRSWYRRLPEGLKWAGAMLTAFFFWELFRFRSLGALADWLKIMLGLTRFDAVFYSWRWFLDARMAFLIAVGVLGSTVLGGERMREAWKRLTARPAGLALREAGLLALFVLAVLCMVNSAYSPFIYFQY